MKKNNSIDNADYFTKNSETVMVGEGEHSIFVEVGITPEESRKRLDKKIDEMLEKSTNIETEGKVKKMVLSLFKK